MAVVQIKPQSCGDESYRSVRVKFLYNVDYCDT